MDSRHLRILVRFRLLQLRHRIAQRLPLMLVAGTVCTAGIVAAGYFLSPDTFGPIDRGGGLVHWGGWPLETAFYLACLIAVLQSFRIMEAFFRHRDARVLATHPARLPAVFFYRLGAVLLETGAMAAGCAVFLLPVWLKGAGHYYGWSIALLVLAVLLVVAIGFAGQMAAGVANYKHLPGFFAELDRRSGGAGGGAAAYLVSPAIALAATLFCVLICKMTIDEVLQARAESGGYRIPGIARLVGGLVAFALVGCLVWAYRNFTRHYPTLFARFFEADLYVVDVGYDYFARDRRPARGLEARLSGRVRTLYRLYRLQLARRSPLARLAALAGPVAGAALFLGYGERLEPWMVVGLGLLWVLFLANPWSRLAHPQLEPGMGEVIPATRAERARARQVLLLREVLLASVPLALCGLLLPTGEQVSVALAIAPLSLALVPPMEALSARAHWAPRAAGVAVALVAAVTTTWGPAGLWIACAAATGMAVAMLAHGRTPVEAIEHA